MTHSRANSFISASGRKRSQLRWRYQLHYSTAADAPLATPCRLAGTTTRSYKTPLIKTHLVLPAFIGDSPLFARANLPKSRFFRFGAPKLQPDALANAIVAQVERGQSGSLSLPLYAPSSQYRDRIEPADDVGSPFLTSSQQLRQLRAFRSAAASSLAGDSTSARRR